MVWRTKVYGLLLLAGLSFFGKVRAMDAQPATVESVVASLEALKAKIGDHVGVMQEYKVKLNELALLVNGLIGKKGIANQTSTGSGLKKLVGGLVAVGVATAATIAARDIASNAPGALSTTQKEPGVSIYDNDINNRPTSLQLGAGGVAGLNNQANPLESELVNNVVKSGEKAGPLSEEKVAKWDAAVGVTPQSAKQKAPAGIANRFAALHTVAAKDQEEIATKLKVISERRYGSSFDKIIACNQLRNDELRKSFSADVLQIDSKIKEIWQSVGPEQELTEEIIKIMYPGYTINAARLETTITAPGGAKSFIRRFSDDKLPDSMLAVIFSNVMPTKKQMDKFAAESGSQN